MAHPVGGRRSRGCNSCRKRKVRCGEEKPACAACVRINKACVYRDISDLLFHHETAHVSDRAKRLWHARSAKVPDVPEAVEVPLQLPTAPATPSSLTELVLFPSQKDVMMQRFIFDFVLERHNTLHPPGYLEFVPCMYNACQPGSSLELAMDAVAYANLGRRGHAPDLAATASRKYGAALQLTSTALKSTSKATGDDTLLSCHLLAMYEMFTPSATSYSDWITHSQGMMALLQLRGEPQFQSSVGMAMFRQAWIQEIVSCIRSCQRPLLSPHLPKQVAPAATVRLYTACGQAASIAADYLEYRKHTGSLNWQNRLPILQAIKSRALQLDDTFEFMAEKIPTNLAYEQVDPLQSISRIPEWLRPFVFDKGAPPYMHKYTNMHAFNVSNWMRWARLRLIQTEIHTTAALQQDITDVDRWTPVLREFVEEFSSSLAFMLMPFDEAEDLQNRRSSDSVRGVKAFFLVRAFAATKMTLRQLERLGAGMRDREAWVDHFQSAVRLEVGMEPFAAPDPMDIPWEFPEPEAGY